MCGARPVSGINSHQPIFKLPIKAHECRSHRGCEQDWLLHWICFLIYVWLFFFLLPPFDTKFIHHDKSLQSEELIKKCCCVVAPWLVFQATHCCCHQYTARRCNVTRTTSCPLNKYWYQTSAIPIAVLSEPRLLPSLSNRRWLSCTTARPDHLAATGGTAPNRPSTIPACTRIPATSCNAGTLLQLPFSGHFKINF